MKLWKFDWIALWAEPSETSKTKVFAQIVLTGLNREKFERVQIEKHYNL